MTIDSNGGLLRVYQLQIISSNKAYNPSQPPSSSLEGSLAELLLLHGRLGLGYLHTQRGSYRFLQKLAEFTDGSISVRSTAIF